MKKHGVIWATILDDQNIPKDFNKEEFIRDLTTFVFGLGDDQYVHLILLSPLPCYANRIKKVSNFSQAEALSGNLQAAKRLEYMMYQLLNIGDKTFLDVCKEGQQEVKKLLQSTSGQKNLSFAKENALRRA